MVMDIQIYTIICLKIIFPIAKAILADGYGLHKANNPENGRLFFGQLTH